MNIQVFLGTINFTDFLHVTVTKVSNPGVVVWEDYIDVPVTNYTFVIPDLDADDYYINFYDAETDDILGTLVSQCFVSALSNEWEYELRFYDGGDLSGGVTISENKQTLTDPYLIGKTIHSVEKEGFRTMDPANEYTFDDATGAIALGGFHTLEPEEKLVVVIKNRVGGAVGPAASGSYSGNLTVTTSTHTLDPLDKGKRVRLRGSGSTQVITLPALSALSVGQGYLFDNACGGTPVQVKLLVNGSDRIQYSGLATGSNEFAEFWVSQGEVFRLDKFDDDYWEVIGDYAGRNVGERYHATYNGHPGSIPEDGRLLDGDEYPRLWWWIKNVLPSTHRITDDTVTSLSYEHPAARIGQFVVHSTLKKFRMPNTQEVYERNMYRFTEFGADDDRSYDYPGGYQPAQAPEYIDTTGNAAGGTVVPDLGYASGAAPFRTITRNAGQETRTENIGVIAMRRI